MACVFLALGVAAGAQGFTATGSLHTARAGAAAVGLADGDVLVLGGVIAVKGGALDSAELYDPGAGTFTATGSMSVARTDPQAVLLTSGQVFVLSAGDTSTEVYSPAAGAFSAGPALPAALDDPHAVLLPDGRVWITGVTHGCQLPDCASPIDIYDPKAGSITAAGHLQWARRNEAVVGLGDGRVLVFQGWSVNAQASSPVGSIALCDASGACAMAPTPVGVALASAGAALIGHGQVLICGGGSHASNATTACEVFDTGAQTLSTTGPMAAARHAPTLTPLPDGTVLVVGSRSGPGPDAEIYNPKLGTFSNAGNFQSARAPFAPGATATLLANGRVLIAGGISATDATTALDEAELFTSAAPAPGFSIAADQTSVIVSTGTTATFKITARGANDFSGTIALSCAGIGTDTCSFDPAGITPGETSTLTVGNLDLTGTPVIQFQAVGASGTTAHTLALRVNLEPPKAELSATGLSFGSQNVGTTSPSQTITLTNGGAGTLLISGIATSSGDFQESDNCPKGIGNGGPSCAIKVAFAPAAAGGRTGTLSISDDAPFSPQTVALTGTGQPAAAPAPSPAPGSASLQPASGGATTATVAPGQSANYSLSLPATDGNDRSVQLSCSGAPAGATCTTTPSSATLGGTPVPVVVIVTTTGASAALPSPGIPPLWPWMAVTGLAALFLWRPRLHWVMAASLGAALTLGFGACGGNVRPASAPANAATRPGTYQLTVTASVSGSQVASAPLTLVVK